MKNSVIRVENLGKRYLIGIRQDAYSTLREAIVSAAQTPLRKLREGGSKNDPQEFWALRDISFEVKQGEVLGIIGHNGAGKSTLLKILARVTSPSTGRAQIRGRTGSLLEVGTGFHLELTGRENIYLNGAILGMRKAEIEQKFDKIVEFAEIEQFLDTPVKRYSSGMYMRLAFAVAAYLEPEILIVDEVLAVGDIQFQKKCLGKMQDVARSDGRTVLFVSHNMDAVKRLCSKCLLLEDGQLTYIGTSAEVVAHYLSHISSPYEAPPDTWIDISKAKRTGTGEVRFTALRYTSHDSLLSGQPYSTGPLEFMLELESDASRSLGSLAVSLCDPQGNRLINADSVLVDRVFNLRRGRNLVRLRIKNLYLNPGVYKIGLWLADPIRARSENSPYDYIETAFEIEVVNPASRGNGLKENAFVTCDFDLMELPS
jgi:ABC-type polysaccharide/polyol phosphate transport system ATPase subunit